MSALTHELFQSPARRCDETSYGTLVACAAEPNQRLALSIVVPTRNESANIAPLLERIVAATTGIPSEVIFVDDSTDETTQVILDTAPTLGLPTKVVARPPERRNGLGKAVVEGMRLARAEWICVLDGDLQHPPEVIPQLLGTAQAKDVTLVLASRLRAGGAVDGLSPRRRLVSYLLANVSRAVFPRRLRDVTDPLTGFFLVRRDMLQLDDLQPEGFKILLEILVRTPDLVVAEVPFAFGERQHGSSKAGTLEVVRLSRQMAKLAFASQQQLLRFMAVGLSGLLVNTLLLYLFTGVFGVHYLWSAMLATEGSTAWNFLWSEYWVFGARGEENGGIWLRAGGFFLLNNLLLLVRGPMLAGLVEGMAMNYLVANVVTIGLLMLARYAVADRVLWRSADKAKVRKAKRAYYYNIHNIVHIRSAQRLPELAFFRSDEEPAEIDIDVKIAFNPAAQRTPDAIYYRESLGPLGFAIVVDQTTEPVRVVASKLVGASPHVLYTNVVEPLLRWTLARKDYALMHGACIEQSGQALFITARTDTGKTTTILRTMRENAGNISFLSDDMSIFSSDGTVRSYPKPLTISSHTLQAMGGSSLRWRENAFLQLQSRLHSRSGRRFAMLISKLHLPAATINAVVQIIVPPPKFMIDRLIPAAQYAREAQIAHIVVIERGGDYQAPLPEEEKFETLISNAEDAYGFPPYPQIASRLCQWRGVDLHTVEQRIVTAAVQALPALRMGSTKFDWHQRLPLLVGLQHAGEQYVPALAPITSAGELNLRAQAAESAD